MEAIPPIRSSLSGTLLVVVRLSTLLFQNRAHLYHFLLLKIILFNHWLSGLTQEARGVPRWAGPRLGGAKAGWGPAASGCSLCAPGGPLPVSCPLQALLENRVVLDLLALLKRLYRRAESTTARTSWHVAYLVTWTTCLASHLLQAAFEHTAQLAQAQEAEPQEASGLWSESPLPEPWAPKAGPVLPEPGNPGE
nr:transmembrane protein 270 [Vicugna pacos]